VDLEPGDRLGGGAGDLGDQTAAVVVDPPGGICGFDGQCPSGMDDTDVDPLLGNDESPRRCTRSDSADGVGGGPAGRASLSRACSALVSGFGKDRSNTPWSTNCSRPRSSRTV
jgi:hypothetical protein